MLEVVAVVGELLSWIALAGAAVLGMGLLIVRAGRGPWVPTDVVIDDEHTPATAYWIVDEQVYHRQLDEHETGMHSTAPIRGGTMRQRAPEHLRLDPRVSGERHAGRLALLLLGVAALSLVASALPALVA